MSISCFRQAFGCLSVFFVVLASQARGEEPRCDAYGDPLPAEVLRRLGMARFHAGFCGTAALSPQGDVVATATLLDGIRLFDAVSGKELRRFERPIKGEFDFVPGELVY